MAGRFGNVGATFLGGVDRGQRAAENKQAQQDARRKQLQTKAKEAISLARDSASQLVEKARALPGGLENPKFRQAFKTLQDSAVGSVDSLVANGVPSPVPRNTLVAAFDSMLQQPTLEQEADAEAARQSTVTRATETVKREVNPPKPDSQTYLNTKTGERISVNLTGEGATEKVATLEAQGYVPISEGVTATSTSGLSTSEQADRRSRERGAQGRLEALSGALRNIRDTPGAVGTPGVLAEKVGGVLAQIPIIGGSLEEGLTQMLTGASPDEVKQVRTEMQLLAADLLSAITGEESKRFTEAEQRLARETLAQLPADATVAQSRAALKTVLGISLDEMIRVSAENEGKPRWDLSEPGGRAELFEFVNTNYGLTEEEAADIVVERVLRSRMRQ